MRNDYFLAEVKTENEKVGQLSFFTISVSKTMGRLMMPMPIIYVSGSKQETFPGSFTRLLTRSRRMPMG